MGQLLDWSDPYIQRLVAAEVPARCNPDPDAVAGMHPVILQMLGRADLIP
jgi:hypothetical protein